MLCDLAENQSVLEYIKSLNILCVEDDKTTQVLYASFLEESVESLTYADDGLEGYQQFLDKKIDIIISDYDMPKLNGLQMIQKIKERDDDIPIILVSSIEEMPVLVKAIELGVSTFVKKPIIKSDLIEALKKASKILLANKYIEEKRKDKLELLEAKNSYNSYQEDLAFSKELNILRNDFYYQMVGEKNISLVDFLYQPLDVMSGDAYSARRIDKNRNFYLIVDGMGKGLSASLTAMIMISFINHIIDKMIEFDSFSFELLIKESMEYIKPTLLDEEALSLDYILINSHYDTLQYSKFAMPAFLLEDDKCNVLKINSNNPPLSKWLENYNVDEFDIKEIKKFLFYSDGIVENSVDNGAHTYAEYIEKDFQSSFTREEFKEKIFEKLKTQEDDLTLIFINKLGLYDACISSEVFETSLSEIDRADEWYVKIWNEITDDASLVNSANIVFTELFMNAYEHGNLGINAAHKHQLLDDDIYFETLSKYEKKCNKMISVTLNKIQTPNSTYIVSIISDEGEGFDTQILSEIFRNSTKFNGRGVFISRKNSMGIYYNAQGNTVLYLSKI